MAQTHSSSTHTEHHHAHHAHLSVDSHALPRLRSLRIHARRPQKVCVGLRSSLLCSVLGCFCIVLIFCLRYRWFMSQSEWGEMHGALIVLVVGVGTREWFLHTHAHRLFAALRCKRPLERASAPQHAFPTHIIIDMCVSLRGLRLCRLKNPGSETVFHMSSTLTQAVAFTHVHRPRAFMCCLLTHTHTYTQHQAHRKCWRFHVAYALCLPS